MASVTGPLLSDECFFNACIGSAPGMEAVKAAAAKGDFAAARAAFAAAVRKNLNPAVYFSVPGAGGGGNYHYKGESAVEAADGICRREITVCGTPHTFPGPIDWFANPTFNKYKEWTWQLSRHNEWPSLCAAYRQTGDEKYARCFAGELSGWLKQAVRPDADVSGWETLCWRTIECGIRMSGSWPDALYTFCRSPAFTDDLLVDWYKSVQEHGERLLRQHRKGNWLIMEMNGLAQIGLMYPELAKAGEWYDYAVKKLDEELDRQIYPDGFQFELTTGYHNTILYNYHQIMLVMKAYGREAPAAFRGKLEKAAEV